MGQNAALIDYGFDIFSLTRKTTYMGDKAVVVMEVVSAHHPQHYICNLRSNANENKATQTSWIKDFGSINYPRTIGRTWLFLVCDNSCIQN